MARLRETGVAIGTGLRLAFARPRHTLLIAFGFLIAGITLVILLTIPAGLKRVAGKTGLLGVAVVLPNGASTESSGTFSSALAAQVGSLPGVAHAGDGRPLVAPQFAIDTRLVRRDGSTATVLVRGVTPMFWGIVGKSVTLASGKRFAAGKDQLIAGVADARAFVSLATGDVLRVHNQPWQVTGQFSAGGGFWESQLWTGMAALQSAYNAQGKLSALWVKLDSPAAFKTFSKALHDDPQTQGLYAETQRDYYSYQTIFLQSFIHIAAVAIALALGLGAILAIVNALGMALDARRRDLAILRAVGFRRVSLAVALLAEVLVVGAICAGIAILIGWLAVNGREVGSSTLSNAIQFKLRVDGSVIGWTVVYLLAIGILSAIWPVIRALRAPLTHALQDE